LKKKKDTEAALSEYLRRLKWEEKLYKRGKKEY
jgi:hypothetical protein